MFITKSVRSYEIKYIDEPKIIENLPCTEVESFSEIGSNCDPDRV